MVFQVPKPGDLRHEVISSPRVSSDMHKIPILTSAACFSAIGLIVVKSSIATATSARDELHYSGRKDTANFTYIHTYIHSVCSSNTKQGVQAR